MTPEPLNQPVGLEPGTNLVPVIEAFYDALSRRDDARIGQIVDEHFAADAVLERPESLPGGGATHGIDDIKQLLTAAARVEGPLDVSQLRATRIVADPEGDAVAVQLEFPFAGRPSGALELWTVRDLEVCALRSYYWDTKAMVG